MRVREGGREGKGEREKIKGRRKEGERGKRVRGE